MINKFLTACLTLVLLKSFGLSGTAAEPSMSDRFPKKQAEARSSDPYERVFEAVGKPHDSATLIEFLSDLACDDEGLANLPRLIEGLGHAQRVKRKEAQKRLNDIGLVALPYLHEAQTNPDLEVARLAAKCLRMMPRGTEAVKYTQYAVRLLVQRDPPQTRETLIQYLPFSNDPVVGEIIYRYFAAHYSKNQTIGREIEDAVLSPIPSRRALAGLMIARYGPRDHLGLKKLLDETDETVLLRTA